jgi:hypothetical protein
VLGAQKASRIRDQALLFEPFLLRLAIHPLRNVFLRFEHFRSHTNKQESVPSLVRVLCSAQSHKGSIFPSKNRFDSVLGFQGNISSFTGCHTRLRNIQTVRFDPQSEDTEPLGVRSCPLAEKIDLSSPWLSESCKTTEKSRCKQFQCVLHCLASLEKKETGFGIQESEK